MRINFSTEQKCEFCEEPAVCGIIRADVFEFNLFFVCEKHRLESNNSHSRKWWAR
jgi:hypothetical protein